MGRPYADELKQLRMTYDWAMKAEIESLTQAIRSSITSPMIAIGSGGSFTAADFACSLHQSYANLLSRPFTPMEFASYPICLNNTSLMIVSAAGTNSDILAAFRSAMLREPRQCVILSLRSDSPLSELAQRYHFVDLLNFEPASKKDGFLSTNSLLALVILLSRSYVRAIGAEKDLPSSIEELTGPTNLQDTIDNYRGQSSALWNKQTILVIYGPNLRSAAIDLESKFSEAALGHVQLADFRNFAHGRHNWLAKRASTTGVLALFSDEDVNIAQRTLALIPKEVPVSKVHIPGTGVKAGVTGILAALYLVGDAANSLGLDPGRPGIPRFGRRIYGLRGLNYIGGRKLTNSPEAVAIARKTCSDVRTVRLRTDYTFWQKSYDEYLTGLEKKRFTGVVFDYDGTLCGEHNRYIGLQDEVRRHLNLLLESGIIVGIATGRGKSAKEDLRRVIPVNLWGQVQLTYYNGSQSGALGDNDCPDSRRDSSCNLERIADLLLEHPLLKTTIKCDVRNSQISIIPLSPVHYQNIYRTIAQIVNLNPELKVLQSAHSIDVLPKNVSKSSLVIRVKQMTGGDVLCVGDKGQWPGNDFDLLDNPFSLSVDQVSGDPRTCWNLAPTGHRGVQATLDYLACFKISSGSFGFDLNHLKVLYSTG